MNLNLNAFVSRLPCLLKRLSQNDTLDRVIVVLGNESVDLDSVACSLALAYHLHKQAPSSGRVCLPFLNCPRQDLDLKTEVGHCLSTKLGIDMAHIPCRSDVDLVALSGRLRSRLDIVLVDHHSLGRCEDKALSQCVTQIIDHRPLGEAAALHRLPRLHDLEIRLVGSCATLVVNRICMDNAAFSESACLHLMRWAILIDTYNLSPTARRATAEDVRTLERIEQLLDESPDTRSAVFKEILQVKNDLAGLTVEQILRKDLKLLEVGENRVAISSVMMSAKALSSRAQFLHEVSHFAQAWGAGCCLVMGVVVDDQAHPQRDILIYPANCPLGEAITRHILAMPELKLQHDRTGLELASSELADQVAVFRQGDASYSRKKLLPAVEALLKGL